MVKVTCPECGRRYDVAEEDIGSEGRCIDCGLLFVMRPIGGGLPPPAERPVAAPRPFPAPASGARRPGSLPSPPPRENSLPAPQSVAAPPVATGFRLPVVCTCMYVIVGLELLVGIGFIGFGIYGFIEAGGGSLGLVMGGLFALEGLGILVVACFGYGFARGVAAVCETAFNTRPR